LHLDLPITVGEAYEGAKVKVPTPHGSVSLTVPPHTQSGQVARLKGKGVAKKNAAPGDLYVHFLIHLPVAEGSEIEQAVHALQNAQTGDLREQIEF
jgi:curved DNA-binding protein